MALNLLARGRLSGRLDLSEGGQMRLAGITRLAEEQDRGETAGGAAGDGAGAQIAMPGLEVFRLALKRQLLVVVVGGVRGELRGGDDGLNVDREAVGAVGF